MTVVLPETRFPTVVTDPAGAALLGRVLGVWAHPDDEAYLSAGLMALARGAGNEVVCVTATTGEHGTADPDRYPPARLSAIRRREMAASMAAVGVCQHRFLGLEDGTLAAIDPGPQIGRLRQLMAWYQPDTIVTFGPDGMTGHPDHVAVSSWATAPWERTGRKARLLYATTTDAFADRFAHLHDQLDVFGPGLPMRTLEEDLALTVRLTGAHLDTKMAALHAHASQVGVLVDTFGPEVFRAWWQEETFVDAREMGI